MAEQAVKKILVVDDEEEVLVHLSSILKRANYEVIATTKGKEAVELALALRPNLIILDVLMPDMGGSEVASILMADPSTADIPIIFLTGILTKEEEETVGGRTGKRYVIAKPTSAEEILTIARKVLPI